MHHFAYRDRVLHAEAVNLAALADIVGTPFYCYSSATIERHYNVFAAAFADVDALLAQFRTRRMSVAENLSAPGRAALAAPIFDHNNRIVAAIAVIGVQGRLDLNWDGRPARALHSAARKLSLRLGASPDLIG